MVLVSILAPSQSRDAAASVAIYRPEQIVRFTGSGSGHGVGLSQWGAKGRAEQGMTASQIVSTYYRGTELSQWPTESTQVRVLVDEQFLPAGCGRELSRRQTSCRATYSVTADSGPLMA